MSQWRHFTLEATGGMLCWSGMKYQSPTFNTENTFGTDGQHPIVFVFYDKSVIRLSNIIDFPPLTPTLVPGASSAPPPAISKSRQQDTRILRLTCKTAGETSRQLTIHVICNDRFICRVWRRSVHIYRGYFSFFTPVSLVLPHKMAFLTFSNLRARR